MGMDSRVKARCSLLHTNVALHWVGGEADRADEVMSRVVELGAHVTIATHIMCGDPEGSEARGVGGPKLRRLRELLVEANGATFCRRDQRRWTRLSG